MPRGGHKPKLPPEQRAKMVSVRLYQEEIPIIKQIIKDMHKKRKESR